MTPSELFHALVRQAKEGDSFAPCPSCGALSPGGRECVVCVGAKLEAIGVSRARVGLIVDLVEQRDRLTSDIRALVQDALSGEA